MERDEYLYQRYNAGEEEALAELIERYGDALTRYINHYLQDIHDAEDLMIEAFARVIAKNPRFDETGFKAYLFKTARHLALRHISKYKRMESFDLLAVQNEPLCHQLWEDSLVAEEQNQVLNRCLDAIHADYREVLYLLYYQEMSYAQAAKVMGKNQKQIANLAHRGKQALRLRLEEEGITNAQY